MVTRIVVRNALLAFICAAFIFMLGGCNDTADIDLGGANASTGMGHPGSGGGTGDNAGGGNGQPAGSNGDNLPVPEPAPATNQSFDTFGDNGTFLSILPPGESDNGGTGNQQGLPPVGASPHFNDQLKKYRDLTFASEDLTTDQLAPTYYHKESFQPESAFSDALQTVSDGTYSARYAEDDATGTPHIYGDTRDDVFFGIGYVNGLDRLFLMDALRHIGRGRFSDFLGPAAGNYDMDRELGLFAGYSEQEIQDQIDKFAARYGTTGAQLKKDAQAFVAGINDYIADVNDPTNTTATLPVEYAALGLTLNNFTTRDVLGTAILIEATFGVGGGSEDKNVRLLNGIAGQVGKNANACKLWHDILQSDDPERPNTITTRFETQSPPTFDTEACPFDSGFAAKYPGAVLFDAGSFQPRQLLTIQNCLAPDPDTGLPLPDPSLPGAPACPDFKQDPSITQRFDSDDNSGSDAGVPGTGGGAPSLPPIVQIPDSSPLLALLDGRAATSPQTLPGPAHTQVASSNWINAIQVVRQARLQKGRQLADETIRGLLAFLNSDEKGGLGLPTAMSNALLVTKDNTANGHPLAVFGPQTAYFAPELELEFEAHGGGIDTRGMNFAGLPFVLIGRGKDFSWSATSAGADVIDIRALKLCNPDDSGSDPTQSSRGYIYNGKCKAFYQRTDDWTAETNATTVGTDNQVVTRSILRAPDYGPVMGFATVNGQPIALAIQRSTFMHTLGAALPFSFLDGNVVHDPQSFMQAFNLMNATFNWFYIDDNNIAYFMSGLLPKRADGIYPPLPQWGDGNYDWAQKQTGTVDQAFDLDNFLPLANHPHATNPERGYLTSWNNGQAPGFYASDSQYSYGPVYRVDMLNKRLLSFLDTGKKLQPADLVTVMMDGGSTDLRGQEILPLALEILQQPNAQPALTDDEKTAVGILDDWLTDGPRGLGVMRRDRNNDGQYDKRQAVVLMDSWYNRMIDDALPQLVSLEKTGPGNDVNVVPLERDNHPNDQGSSYQTGYYGYLQRVLAMALGQSDHPYRSLKCAGTGDLDDCRQALIDSLDDAIAALGGIGNRDNWDGTQDNNGQHDGTTGSDDVETRDMISFRAIGLAGVQDILWQNRPTYQQVVSPTASRTAR